MVKNMTLVIFILCFSLMTMGCPKKTVVKGAPSTREADALKAEHTAAQTEKERVAKLEAERREREEKEAARLKEEEAARIREQEARRMEEEKAKKMKEEEARKMREEEAKKAAASKEFEKSLIAKRIPGIEGEVFESRLLKDIFFDFDRYDIRPEEAEVLKENAALLMQYPKVKIQIEGHCDERGTREYNLALGQRRASSAKNYLLSLGIPEQRISTISFGEERPFDTGTQEESWRKNRRAHFVILSK